MNATVVGGGLAGCEAAWALAERGVDVRLHEMRPLVRTPAHQTDRLAEIVARGHPPSVVERIQNLLYVAEYKRRQAAPGVKISARNFGRDRRYPITNRFREKL